MSLRLFNTLTRKKEIFRPARGKLVRFYACGPTVYQRAHIGNLRTYINEDILKRVLMLSGYRVKHVMNITDVGHLESDADTGEDKIEKEARRQRKSAWDIAREYEAVFKKDLESLNILPPDIFPRATEHISEQIKLIQRLEQRGFTYQTSDGIYFNTSRFKKYGALVKEKLKGLRAGARIKLGEKKNPTDFALWKFSPQDKKRQMEWRSPWGVGFPGWHIECSAMSIKYLGMPIDIHAGGVDHIHPHHTNEIAQSEGAFGKKFVNFWLHSEFLKLGKTRMGKSEGNAITLDTLEKKGFEALDFRYLVLTAHYRSPLSFSWRSLEAARMARRKLKEAAMRAKKSKARSSAAFEKEFLQALNNDLDTPRALAFTWKKARDARAFKLAEKIFGSNLDKAEKISISSEVKLLLRERESLRKKKQWSEADKIREKILKLGFGVEDTPDGPKVRRA